MLLKFSAFTVVGAIFFSHIFLEFRTEEMSQREHKLIGSRTALLIGATGAVGSKVLKQLLASDEWTKIITVTRKPLPENSKLDQLILADDFVSQLDTVKNKFGDVDHVFHCIGTTRAIAGSAKAFKDVEYGITNKVAEAAKQLNVKSFSVVSAQGANKNMFAVDWFHPLLYIKTMGRKEQSILDQKFIRTTIFQPGMLDRQIEGGREMPFSSWLPKLKVETLARAMIYDAESTPPGDEVEVPLYYTGNKVITAIAEQAAKM